SSSGNYMSMFAFGHTGFTGTSVWLDPENDLFVILLTNRVHPSRANRKIIKFRPIIHNLIMRSLNN
ncbi:MAG: serine hydrolase, partial [Calditrichaeota bacterium]